MKKVLLLDVIIGLLLILFLYTGFSKVFGFSDFVVIMHGQPFPGWLNTLLTGMTPALEIATAGLLLFERTRRRGLLLASFMMAGFTGYTGLVWLHGFAKTPCPCGKLIASFSWSAHFLFNSGYLVISITGCLLSAQRSADPLENISRAKSG